MLRVARQVFGALLLSVFVFPQFSALFAAVSIQTPHKMSCCKTNKAACCHRKKESSGFALRSGIECSRQCGGSGFTTESSFVTGNGISSSTELNQVRLSSLPLTRIAAASGYLAFLHQRPPPTA